MRIKQINSVSADWKGWIMGMFSNIRIAKETLEIISAGEYVVNGKTIRLPENDFEKVVVYDPRKGEELLKEDLKEKPACETTCRYRVSTEDSFQAAERYEHAFVLNFANAHKAGGAFRLGASAQEEALCRNSTLYASISSKAAREMYRYNNTHLSRVESDYMLYSPEVCVFRNERGSLKEKPFMTSVVTVPAPNRYGMAFFASKRCVRETMMRRMRIMFRIAAKHGHRNLILGAWGCGAFGNNPKDVASDFKTVLVDEHYERFFDEVCFAIYGRENSANVRAFRGVFDSTL